MLLILLTRDAIEIGQLRMAAAAGAGSTLGEAESHHDVRLADMEAALRLRLRVPVPGPSLADGWQDARRRAERLRPT